MAPLALTRRRGCETFLRACRSMETVCNESCTCRPKVARKSPNSGLPWTTIHHHSSSTTVLQEVRVCVERPMKSGIVSSTAIRHSQHILGRKMSIFPSMNLADAESCTCHYSTSQALAFVRTINTSSFFPLHSARLTSQSLRMHRGQSGSLLNINRETRECKTFPLLTLEVQQDARLPPAIYQDSPCDALIPRSEIQFVSP
jgi:hypothetical protein